MQKGKMNGVRVGIKRQEETPEHRGRWISKDGSETVTDSENERARQLTTVSVEKNEKW